MCIFHQLFQLTFLILLFRQSTGNELSTQPDEIIGNIRNLLIRGGDKMTNVTQPKLDENRTRIQPIPNDDIVGEIISLLNCGPFTRSPNSHLQYSLDSTGKTLTLFQACNRHFETTKTTESLQVVCKYDKWIFNETGCEKTSCPRLTVPTGVHISTKNNTYNTTVYFWCSPGLSIKGTDKLFCEESGVWNFPPPTCEISYCHPLPSPRYGFVSSQEKTATNQTVTFTCESEYSLFGSAVLRCQNDGRWNTTVPVCNKMCTVPNIIESQLESVRLVPVFKYLPNGFMVQQGRRVIFSCKPGYTVSLSGLSTCIGGAWRPPILCRKACAVVDIANGKYTLSKDSSTIEYSCLPGYQLIGQRKLTCTRNTTWDNESPACGKLCTLPERNEVLSYRRRETYEIIPSGTQIAEGSKVHFVCRWKNVQRQRVAECRDGLIIPYPCMARLVKNQLQLYEDGQWYNICRNSNTDLCHLFGYQKKYISNSPYCSCRYFAPSSYDVHSRSSRERCAQCSRKK